jgi:alpha-L-rhamnosidase
MWERWDSMLPNGEVNPGDMTSFNHYALGAVATFMHERLGGLRCVEAGWKKSRAQPIPGGEFRDASVSHITPFGRVACRPIPMPQAFHSFNRSFVQLISICGD